MFRLHCHRIVKSNDCRLTARVAFDFFLKLNIFNAQIDFKVDTP